MHFSYCMHLISGDRPWIQPATLFTKVNSSVKTGELLRCRRLFEARGLEVHWVLPKGRHEVSARRPRWWITDVAILGIKHHNFNGGYIHGACAQKRYHKVMLIEDISGNTAQAIFASLSHDHKYHKWTSHWQSMSLSNLLKDLAPFCCMAFSECSVGSKISMKIMALLGSWHLLAMAKVSGPCALYLAEPELHRAQTRHPARQLLPVEKKILIYGESMVNLYGESLWWISMVNLWQFWWDDDFHRWVLGAPHWTQPGGKHKWPWRIAIVSDLLFNFVQDWEMSRKYEMYNKLWMITGFKHKFVHPVPNQQRYFLGSWSAQTPIK